MEGLRVLLCAHNGLRELPDCMGHMQLETLNVSNNALMKVRTDCLFFSIPIAPLGLWVCALVNPQSHALHNRRDRVALSSSSSLMLTVVFVDVFHVSGQVLALRLTTRVIPSAY